MKILQIIDGTSVISFGRAVSYRNASVTHQDLGLAVRLPAPRGYIAPENYSVPMHGQFVCTEPELSCDANLKRAHA